MLKFLLIFIGGKALCAFPHDVAVFVERVWCYDAHKNCYDWCIFKTRYYEMLACKEAVNKRFISEACLRDAFEELKLLITNKKPSLVKYKADINVQIDKVSFDSTEISTGLSEERGRVKMKNRDEFVEFVCYFADADFLMERFNIVSFNGFDGYIYIDGNYYSWAMLFSVLFFLFTVPLLIYFLWLTIKMLWFKLVEKIKQWSGKLTAISNDRKVKKAS